MSSAVNTEEDRQLFIYICCDISATALLVYEYLITFDREYQLVWKRRFSAATLLFLLARYSLFLDFILILPTIYPISIRSCSALSWLSTAFNLLFLFLVAAFSSLRAYALSGRQWQIASLIFILSLVPCGIDLFVYVREIVVVAPPPINCTSMSLVSPELTNILVYVERAATITADILVIVVTIHQTYWQRRAAADANLRTPFHTVILRDGTIYFFALLMMNIANIVSFYFGQVFEDTSYIDNFRDPITAILISRFMLNLREIDASQRGTEDSSRPSFVGSVQFAAFVEPLGAPLHHEFSFSAIDRSSLDEQIANREGEHEQMLDNDEEIELVQMSFHEPSQAEAGPSGLRE